MIEQLPLLAWPRNSLLSILIYHRVLDKPSALFPEEVDAERFDRQMRYLARNFSVLPLLEAVQDLKHGTLPRRACCITFDDGYADNLTVALPILEKYGLTATVFVATGYVNGGCMFNDAVVEIITRTTRSILDFSEFGLECYKIDSAESRRDSILKIVRKTRFSPPEQRDEIVKKMSVISGIDFLPNNLMLTKTQLEELSGRGIEIGGHTVSHPILTTVADSRALSEIALGKQTLENWIGKPVRCFAYPNGLPERDFTPHHASMVRDLGFELAVTTANGIANRQADPFQLPRFIPWSDSMVKFGARMVRKAWTSAV